MRAARHLLSMGLVASTALAAAVGLTVPAHAASQSSGAATGAAVKTTGAATTPTLLPGTFASVTPSRVLDTSSGLGAPKAAVAAGATIKVALLGRAGVPSSGVAAVAINLTVSSATASGSLTAYPDGTTRPGTSALSFTAGATVGNVAFVQVPASGVVDLYNGSAGPVQVAADVKGYFVAGKATVPGAYVPLSPQRIFDTVSGVNTASAPVAANAVASLNVRGLGGLPIKGLDTVTLNVTVTGATAAGWLSAFSKAGAHGGPTVSFSPGRASASLITVGVGPGGGIGFYNNSTGTVQVTADVQGYTLAGPTPLYPTTVPAWTELGVNQPGAFTVDPGRDNLATDPTTVPGKAAVSLTVPSGTFPLLGVGTAVFDLTTDGSQSAAGSLTAYATGSARPATTDLSFAAGQSATGLVLSDVDRSGSFTIYNSSASPVRFWIGPAGFFIQQRAPSLSWVPQVVDPPRGNLTDISCPALGSCTEVDQYGNAIAQTATGWAHALPVFGLDNQGLMDGKGLQHVSCPTTTFCAAVGIWGVAVETSGKWSVVAPLETNGDIEITGVSCASSTFCVVGDDYGQVFTWNGTTWSAPVHADPNGLSGISCPSTGVCFGVDSEGGVAQLSGGTWRVTAHAVSGLSNEFNGDQISCPTTSFCEATSSQDSATYSGGSWHASTPISFADISFPAHLSCASATLCMFAADAAVGQPGLSWTTTDGHTWTSHPSSLLSVRGVDCQGTSCLLVGSTTFDDSYGNPQTQQLTGPTWTAPQDSDSDDAGNLVGLSCPTTTWCMAEDGGYYQIDNAGTWTWPAPLPAGISAGAALHCVSAKYCTVNASHTIATWRGSSWSLGPKVSSGNITQLSCPTTKFCMAIDNTGAIFTKNGTTWKAATKVPADGPAVLDCASATYCVGAALVGLTLESYRWSGGIWSTITVSDHGEYPEQMSCPQVGSCVLVEDDGTVAELTGSTWSNDPGTSGNDGGGWELSCLGSNTCQVLVDQDTIMPLSDSYSGMVQRLFLPGAQNVRWGAISCPSITHCVATDNMGIAWTGVVP